MEVDCIPFSETGYFSKIVGDYLEESESIKPFYEYSPTIETFSEVIKNKEFSKESRETLTSSLVNQYAQGKLKLAKFENVQSNIQLLNEENTFTITTGHQLCLFTGPLYFIYKIVSVINLCKQLKEIHPDKNFVPIYWMATEDHDFAEVNHFYFQGKKIEWKTNQKGAVGRMKLDGLDQVFAEFESLLVDFSGNSERLKTIFKNAYLKHENLAHATRYLVNELFHAEGLVILDGDDSQLKSLFSPIMREELLQEVSSEKVGSTSEKLGKSYKIQVNAREINLFYLRDNARDRIVRDGNEYLINETEIRFSEEEILDELKNKPENFSPNVLLRPVYQECILPNLAYIGGGGELAYWFQLKSSFEHFNIPMPMLLLRNSVMWLNSKQHKYFKNLNLSLKDLFLREGDLAKKWTLDNASEDLKLAKETQELEILFDSIITKMSASDLSLAQHAEATKVKQLKAVVGISEKYIRTKRKQSADSIRQITYLKETLFPNGSLQERRDNFSTVYLELGQELISHLLEELKLPTKNFTVFKA